MQWHSLIPRLLVAAKSLGARVYCDGIHCDDRCSDITNPTNSTHVETVFWGWRSRISLSLSLSSWLCAAPVDLLDHPYLQVLHGVIQLTKVGRNWLFCLPCSCVIVVSHILMYSTFSIFSTYCRLHFLCDIRFFYLSWNVVSNVVLSPCNLAFKCVACHHFLAAFSLFGPKHCIELWRSCVHSKIVPTIRSQISSLHVCTQRLIGHKYPHIAYLHSLWPREWLFEI